MADKTPTVLIVDDTESNLDILVDLLSSKYDVSTAIDGDSTLQITKDQDFDLILLDIVMPGMDGFEVCRRLKSNDKTSKIPVVFVSANSGPDEKKNGFSLGAVDFISKPFQPSEVLYIVEKHLRKA